MGYVHITNSKQRKHLSSTLLRRWPGGDSVQNFHRVEDEFAGRRSHGCLPVDTRSFLRITGGLHGHERDADQ